MNFDYHLENVNNRIADLLTVLQYDTEEVQKFTISERILINQERAAMMDFKNYLFKEFDYDKVRFYRVPESIETKIQTILKTIEFKNWQPKIKIMNNNINDIEVHEPQILSNMSKINLADLTPEERKALVEQAKELEKKEKAKKPKT